jgi:hypothetical protein
MSGSPMPPSFKVLAAALRRTTEVLARELVHPTDSPPAWNEIEWAIARSAAAMQGISVLLARNLSWPGPPVWREFLAEQHEQGVLRHAAIGALLERIDAVLRESGVGCVALKGAALRALDLYRPGERPMGDVDLLVRSAELPSAAAAIAKIGYVEAFTSQRHGVYEPRRKVAPRGFGEHVDNPLKIEIHTVVAEALPVRKVDITVRLWPDSVAQGLNAYPGLPALLLHLLLHAAGNMRAHALRQIQLHDIAAIVPRLSAADWVELLEPQRDKEVLWWVFRPLALAARYYPGRIPADVLRAARDACPRLLRLATERQSLTDVSWSNLRIHAFPGIEWSRTPLDALRFVRSRVVPSRHALTELQLALAAQPQLERVPWYGMAHGRRILRWLFSHPPRAQTMVSVLAALESAGVRATKADR